MKPSLKRETPHPLSQPILRLRSIFLLKMLSLAVLTALTACGEMIRPVTPTASIYSYQLNDSGSPSQAGSSQYTCPSDPNVLPDYDYRLDGSGRYSVCYNKTSTANIEIHGMTAQSDTICIYPAQVIDSQHIYVKPDLKTQAPWHQCIRLTDSGVFANFPGINYNAVFIAEGPDEQKMTQCLMGGNYYQCPRYSFGKFR